MDSNVPDFLRRVWGICDPPPPIPLSESRICVERIFAFVLKARISAGDTFIANLHRARFGTKIELINSANMLPMPRSTPSIGFQQFYRVQAMFGLNPRVKSTFNTGDVPSINFMDYAMRFVTCPPLPEISPMVYILTLAYLDRVMTRCPGFFLHSYNAHRMFLGAFVCAMKFHEEDELPHWQLAEYGGVTSQELADIEKAFLNAIDYRCFIPPKQFAELELDIVKEVVEGPFGHLIVPVLESNNILGLQKAVTNLNTNGSFWTAPKCLQSPVTRGDFFQGFPIATAVEANIRNNIKFRQAMRNWYERRQERLQLIVEANWKALMEEFVDGEYRSDCPQSSPPRTS